MPELRLDPLEYCAPPAASFWGWYDSADTLAWLADFSTIAFRLELEHVLRSLACGGSGLPPLSLVLLVLAACRDSWETTGASRATLVTFAKSLGLEASDIVRLEDGLRAISRFSPALRHPIEAKVHLLQFLFETGGACRIGEQALAVCDKLLLGKTTPIDRYRSGRCSQPDLRDGMAHLLAGLDRLDEETLQLRQATSLDELVQPAEIDAENWKQTRALVSSLLDDQEFGGIARVARALMAVVHLPRLLWEPEELPMGGFSDIENRGSLDRLLLSELAHDDLTLAVRVALNEALYLRRETPPKTPSLARSILIDVGIRMWGVPRVFATSAALALLATTDHHAVATVYRAQGTQIEKADLATHKGLTEHLGCLAPDVHPGRAVPPFLAALHPQAQRTDCIIVTCEEAAADPEFQRCLARQDCDSLYLATVNRSGDFRLLYQGSHGRKVICEAQLSLDDLLSRRNRRSVPLIDAGQGYRLPAIFYEDPFPLLIPCNRFNHGKSWTVPGYGVLEIARDQRLLWWNSPAHGPQQILDHVPGKALICWGDTQVRGNEWTAVLDQPGDHYQLLTVDIANRCVKLTQLDLKYSLKHSSYSFFTQESGLLAIAKDHVTVLNRSGEVVARIPTQRETSVESYRLEHRHGRFFVEATSGVWYTLSLYGANATYKWQKVCDPRRAGGVELVTMLDWIGHEGPVGITRQGEIYFPEDGHLSQLSDGIRGPIEVLDVSPCGEWVLIEHSQLPRRERSFVSLTSARRQVAPASLSARQMAAVQWVHPTRSHLHRHFTAGGSDSGGQVTLVSRKGQIWTIAMRGSDLWLRPNVMHAVDSVVRNRTRTFGQRVSLPNAAFHLDLATWPDGSQMYLDSRGLLHLRSSDPGIPEATLVLADGAVTGWSADGRTWGNPYYTGHPTNSVASDIFTEVLRPFVERLT